MRRTPRRWWGLAIALVVVPRLAIAQQEGTTVSGTVKSDAGSTLNSASIFIEGLNIGTLTREDGRYTFVVPAARAHGQQVTLTARLIGYKAASVAITLAVGGTVTQDFTLEANPLRLGEVVVTGTNTVTTAEKLGNVRNSVDSSTIIRSQENNIVQALAAKAPNVEVTEASGEPGAGSYIRMRGTRSLASGNSQPLFIVDGVPLDNQSVSTTNFNQLDGLGSGESEGTAQQNRAMDLNPNDIESIEILKGASAGALYGARAGQGVVVIKTKSGTSGATRFSLRSSASFDDINHKYPLQTTYGQGYAGQSPYDLNGSPGAPDSTACDDIGNFFCRTSWGEDLNAIGRKSYDHSGEIYDTGNTFDNALSITGGNDRTTFFMSAGYLAQSGVFVGPNNDYKRATVRLKATQRLSDRLQIGGNIAYTSSTANYVERGNTTNGLQLGLLRTPPDWNNQPYTGENGQITFRFQHPQANDVTTDRGWNNPFWTLYEGTRNSQLGRVFGNVNGEFDALDWLKFNYVIGADYYTDERLEGAPQGSSGTGGENLGRVTEGKIVNYEIDQTITAAASHTFSPSFGATLTVGNNINQRENRQLADIGRTLVAPRPFNLANTVTRDPTVDLLTQIRNVGVFAQATFDLWDQLYLTGAVRNDGSSTFSENHLRSWFPKGSLAWTFTKSVNAGPVLSFGKLRVAYGETGQEPVPYLTTQTFTAAPFQTISQGVGLTPTQAGFGGLATSFQKASQNLVPERTKELEGGFDLGFFNDKADLGFTYYDATTDNVILTVPLATSSGFIQQAAQGAKFQNKGYEVTFNIRPITTQSVAWDVGLQWAQNRSNVLELLGNEFVALDPTYTTPLEVAMKGQPIGVFRDLGWVRCGLSENGMGAVIPDVDLATVCAGKPKGALYIGADGFPVGDPNFRVIGDPNPKWTGSIRTALRVQSWSFSALLDIRHGGDVYNGTKGALYAYGTHKDTEQRATCVFIDAAGNESCTGNMKVFGKGGWYDGPTVGPGAGTAVPIGENWYLNSPVLFFGGYNEPFMEDGSYTKLREISVGYSFTQPWVRRSIGLSSIDLRVAGRNLYTWTGYTGYDPETNQGGAVGHSLGLDYFNQPQARSFVINLTLNR